MALGGHCSSGYRRWDDNFNPVQGKEFLGLDEFNGPLFRNGWGWGPDMIDALARVLWGGICRGWWWWWWGVVNDEFRILEFNLVDKVKLE